MPRAPALGWQPIGLDADALLAKARANTGLADFDGDEFRAPLERLVTALETEARLTTLGRLIARSDLLRVLENRLRLVDLFRRHPEIADQPTEPV